MGKIYRWRDRAAIERFQDRFTKQTRYWTDHVGFGDFEATRCDSDGNILKIKVGDKVYEANRGNLDMYWCLFLAKDINDYFIDITNGEPEVPPAPPEPEDCFVITKSHKESESSVVNGPFTRENADKFAIQQLRNSVEGVRCIVTQLVGEAKAIYKVE